eukprot:6197686-Pleurochrysis_carterae.AAC.2
MRAHANQAVALRARLSHAATSDAFTLIYMLVRSVYMRYVMHVRMKPACTSKCTREACCTLRARVMRARAMYVSREIRASVNAARAAHVKGGHVGCVQVKLVVIAATHGSVHTLAARVSILHQAWEE